MADNNTACFIASVKKQTALYNDIRQSAEIMNTAFLEKDAKKAGEAAAKVEELVSAVSEAEKEKNLALDRMAKELSLGPAALSEVLSRLPKNEAAEAEREVLNLLEAVKAAESTNAKNAYLMKNFIEFSEFSSEAKRRIENPKAEIYDGEARVKNEKPAASEKIDRTI